MAHTLFLGLFDEPGAAARAARELRAMGVARERVSVVARTHEEEGVLASATDASPGSEIEDSSRAARLGELGAHLLAAVALVLPGIGPIVADGPLAAELGEAAGHVAGGLARTLERAGFDGDTAEAWERRVEQGAVLVGAHVGPARAADVRALFERCGASSTVAGAWPD